MSKKTLTIFAALFTFGVVLSALAQDQSSGPAPGSHRRLLITRA